MNAKQAKAVPLPEFLGRLGYQPAHVRGQDIWYTSPLRPNERTPSFKVDASRNVWFDHGLGQGGTIIDFVQHLSGTQDVSHALATIAEILGGAPRAPIVVPSLPARPREAPVIETVGPILDAALERYVQTRAIPLDLARLYLQEVSYRVGAFSYKALGFANDSGGFELRSSRFQGTLGHKDLSYLARRGSRQAAVFEGFFDFLSVLAHYGQSEARSNVLVLNSVALLERGIERLRHEEITKLFGYFDHDAAGQAALLRMQEAGAWEVDDASGLYLGHKDANAFRIEQVSGKKRARKAPGEEREP